MLDMGFVPAIRQIVKLLPRKRQTLFFSATLSREIEELTGEFLTAPETVEIGRRSNPADTVTQSVHAGFPASRSPRCSFISCRIPGWPWCWSSPGRSTGPTASPANLIRPASGRGRSIPTAPRTSASARSTSSARGNTRPRRHRHRRARHRRGRHHPRGELRLPPHHEDYVHRIGRTGRAKAVGEAISFVSREEEESLRGLERFTRRGVPRVKAEGFDYSQPGPPGRGGQPPSRPQAGRGARAEREGSGHTARRRRGGRPDGKPRDISMSGEAGKGSG